MLQTMSKNNIEKLPLSSDNQCRFHAECNHFKMQYLCRKADRTH